MRKHFSPAVKILFSLILSKFREKKTILIEQTKICIDKFVYCVTIEDLVEDLKEGLCDKTPTMKIQTMNFIERIIEK